MREGWEVKTLGEVCDILDNKRKPITKKDRIEGDIPYYGATGILSYVRDYLFDEQLVLLGEDGAKWECGDNSAFIINGKTWVNNHAHVLRPNRKIVEDNWIVYNLNFQNLMPFVSGMTVPKLNQGNMRKIQIPIPPLPEQKQIVKTLDLAFKQIDQAKANTEKNLANAKELFASKLNEVFSQRGEGWEEKRLGDVCNIIGGGTPSKSKEEYYTGDILWATVRDMKKDTLNNTELKITKVAVKNSSTNIIKKNNVIIATRVGLGKVCMLSFDTAINQDLKGIIVKEKYDISNKFIFWWFKSIAKEIINQGTGLTVQGVKLDYIKSLKFPYLTIEKQEDIIVLLDRLNNQKEKLQIHYKQNLNNLEELKKSILEKAFKGELDYAL